MNLQNKVCLVTGGTKGIGGAAAVALAEQGGLVSIVARTIDEEAKKTLGRLGPRAIAVAADVAKPAELARAVDETVKKLGPVDVL
ncbi:MAG TPA: SDR family NAD(P)-dependent oxidoreductase, partial [Planctomycetota bacterium]|nr:SDR family NAD(P)-dependent oxidoreductase [Planctomycetota bacterium]